jgi:SAM-dependent methyltransferase
MQGLGNITAKDLAKKTGTDEQYVHGWLVNQAANNIVDYRPSDETFSFSEEAALVYANENSPHFLIGAIENSCGTIMNADKVIENFKTGKGIRWGDQGKHVSEGTRRFFRPMYDNLLVQFWLPKMDKKLIDKLNSGGTVVADIGCGHGWSTLVLAKAFPKCTFVGLDYDEYSIKRAREFAQERNLSNTKIELNDAKSFSDQTGIKFDLIAFFDCFHDMESPLSVIKSTHTALKDDGTVLLVEPMAGQKVEDNFNLAGQLFSGFSTICCLQTGKASGGHECYGAIAPTSWYEQHWTQGGFKSVKLLAVENTAFNRVFEIQK